MAEPNLNGQLISNDARVAGVNVQLELPQKRPDEASDAAKAARVLAKKIMETYPEIEIRITGFAMLSNAFFEASIYDLSTLIPLMYGILLLTLFLFLKSISGTVLTLVVIMLSAVTAMGTAGWLGIPITPPSSIAPTMIMTLAVADCVHILVVFLQKMQGGASKIDALKYSLHHNMMPVFLTSLTTAIGLFSMNFGEVQPFRDLGNIATIGVLAAFVYSVFLLPVLIMITPFGASVRASGFNLSGENFGNFVLKRKTLLLVTASVIVVGSGILIPQNRLDDQFISYFAESWDFRQDTDYAAENLTGIYQLEFSIEANGADAIAEPKYLSTLESFADWYEKQPGVLHVQTIDEGT